MDEFVPQRTAAYISQHDVHIREMTVRETLAFSARCQGVGSRYGQLIFTSFVVKKLNWHICNLSMTLCFIFENLQTCYLNCPEEK